MEVQKEVSYKRSLDLSIIKNEKLGIIGQTGAGKSTLIDLIIVGLVVAFKRRNHH